MSLFSVLSSPRMRPRMQAHLARPNITAVSSRFPAPVAGEPGTLSDKGFFAQDLPEFPPNVETASESLSEAV